MNEEVWLFYFFLVWSASLNSDTRRRHWSLFFFHNWCFSIILADLRWVRATTMMIVCWGSLGHTDLIGRDEFSDVVIRRRRRLNLDTGRCDRHWSITLLLRSHPGRRTQESKCVKREEIDVSTRSEWSFAPKFNVTYRSGISDTSLSREHRRLHVHIWMCLSGETMERRVQNGVGQEEKDGDAFVSATTTYCQLGTACTKAKCLKVENVDVLPLLHRRDPTSAICLRRAREWDYESLCRHMCLYRTTEKRQNNTSNSLCLCSALFLSLSSKRYYYINCTVAQFKRRESALG